ncbi:Putative ribonuclease H protein [Dendrobium catenatum]|uniref:Ribonuclease H protein n=1 Tax=Dendrobium catenatum TaxID=906689 RepID=A0A2I0XJI5_9ASPA|nr:Putative ribonuclease H protein [Dendrobium catenatum]
MKLHSIWGSKILSVAGKITLVKSILLTLPAYYASHSLVPKRILDELDKLCSNFIWSKSDGSMGLHFVSWEDICKPVSKARRGLFSCASKTAALRARMAWKFFQDRDSLFHEVLAAKYGEKLETCNNRVNCTSLGNY